VTGQISAQRKRYDNRAESLPVKAVCGESSTAGCALFAFWSPWRGVRVDGELISTTSAELPGTRARKIAKADLTLVTSEGATLREKLG
jgi:hypothetical protein